MSTADRTYQQKATHKLNKGETAGPKYNNTALHYKISVDGQAVSVYAATDTQFSSFVCNFLAHHYKTEAMATRKYQQTFNLDWSVQENRLVALNELDALNRIRTCGRQAVIGLFVEEVSSVKV